LNPSLSLDKKLSICRVSRPVFWEPKFKLGERWVSPIGDSKYFLAQFPLFVLSQGLIVTKLEVELDIRTSRQKDDPFIIALSPYLETEFSLPSVICPSTQTSDPIITLRGGPSGSIGFNAQLILLPDIIGIIKAENYKAVWYFTPGHLWRILNSSRIRGFYPLKAIMAIPSEISEITSKLYVKVCAQEWQRKKVYNFYNKFIFEDMLDQHILDHSCL